jgi:hypothetical protein
MMGFAMKNHGNHANIGEIMGKSMQIISVHLSFSMAHCEINRLGSATQNDFVASYISVGFVDVPSANFQVFCFDSFEYTVFPKIGVSQAIRFLTEQIT